MIRFAENDDELAVVVGHEMAHDTMNHITSKEINAAGGLLVDILFAAIGVNTQGAFMKMGAQAYSKEFEAEADYVGLYAAALANNNIDVAPNFWRRMAAAHPGNIKENFMATHPSTPERFLHLEQTIAEIKGKRSQGLALVPDIKKEVPGSETKSQQGLGFAPK